jgi:glycosyltransferase involved in cell wall biosynthesis
MPLISIVVPVFNTAPFLEKCLLSIAEQSLHDFEVICVDDTSTDNSREIVKRFSRKDPRFSLISHTENLHAGGARNSGIRVARSRYIHCCDSDDYMDADLLERAYNSTRNETHDIVVFGYRLVDGSGKIQQKHMPEPREIGTSESNIGRLLITQPAPWNKLVRRSLYTDNGIWFPEKTYWEDLATIPRLMTKAKSIRFIETPLYCYLDREGSHVNRVSEKHLIDYLRALDIIKEFLIKEGLYERDRDDFDSLVRYQFGWFAEKLTKNAAPNSQVGAEGARYCALLAGSYISADDMLRGHSMAQNRQFIERLTRPQTITQPLNDKTSIDPQKPNLWRRLIGRSWAS